MASSYDQYKTTGQYDFSKGPKSLYQPDSNATIDSIFSGVVLNVPQTDTDDEWGGTSRIAEERIIDKLGALELEVEGLAGVGGLKNQMLDLVGTTVKIASFTAPFIDMSVPKISLGVVTATVVLDGATGAITAASLTLTGAISAVSATISGNMSVNGTLNVNIGSFGALTVSSLTVSGSASFSHSLSAASIAVSGAITAASLTLTGAISAVSAAVSGAITAASIAVSGAITAASLTIYSKITLTTPFHVPVCMLEPTSSYVDLGSSTNYFGGIYTSAFTSYTNMFTGYGLFPLVTNTADLGSSTHAFKNIYAEGAITAASLTLTGAISAVSATISGNMSVNGTLNVNIGSFGALTVSSLTVSSSASFSHSLSAASIAVSGAISAKSLSLVDGVFSATINSTVFSIVNPGGVSSIFADITSQSFVFGNANTALNINTSGISPGASGNLSLGDVSHTFVNIYASGTLYVPTVSATYLSLTGTVNAIIGVPNHIMLYGVSGIIAQSTAKFDVDSPTVVFRAPTFKLSTSLPTATAGPTRKYLFMEPSSGQVYVEAP